MKIKKEMMALFILSFVFVATLENAKAKSKGEAMPMAGQKHPPIVPPINAKEVSGTVAVPAIKPVPASALTNATVGKLLPPSVPTAVKVGQGGQAHGLKSNYKNNKAHTKPTASKKATTYGDHNTAEKQEPAKKPQEKAEKTSARPVKTESKSKMKMRIVAPGEE